MNGRKSAFLLLIIAVLATSAPSLWAGGPLYVTGPGATNSGQPYRWALNPIPYHTDLGGLGNQTNAQANSIVASAYQHCQYQRTECGAA